MRDDLGLYLNKIPCHSKRYQFGMPPAQLPDSLDGGAYGAFGFPTAFNGERSRMLLATGFVGMGIALIRKRKK